MKEVEDSKVTTIAHIQIYFDQRNIDWVENSGFEKYLVGCSLFLLCMAIITVVIGGHQAGFFTLQNIGLEILPEFAWENITFTGDTLVALTIAFLFSYRYPKIVISILISAVIGSLLIHGLKNSLQVLRPPAFFGEDLITVIGPVYKKGSMPSGHTATVFILAGILTQCIKTESKKWLLIFAACIVAWSRVVCGVHWPIDVLAGASIGLFSAWLGLRLSHYMTLSLRIYLPIVSVLFLSSIILLNFDGGFESTGILAQMLGFSAIFYWLLSWSLELSLKPSQYKQTNIIEG